MLESSRGMRGRPNIAFPSNLKSFLEGQILLSLKEPISGIVIGYSGGADSSALLHLIWQLKHQNRLQASIRLIHFQHGASEIYQSCRDFCSKRAYEYGFPIEVIDLSQKLSRTEGPFHQGFEAAARDLRYQYFKSRLAPTEVVLTAHHRDDQCEGFLLALKRGSGPKGLSGMAPSRPLSGPGARLIRPLLRATSSELRFYLKENGITHVEDPTNQTDQFDRNFLRNTILPHFQKRWPEFAAQVFKSAELCAEQELAIDHFAGLELKKFLKKDGSLGLDALRSSPYFARNALLRCWLKRFDIRAGRNILDHLCEYALSSKSLSGPFKLNSETLLRRYREHLYLQPKPNFLSNSFSMPLDLQALPKLVELPAPFGSLSLSTYSDARPELPILQTIRIPEQIFATLELTQVQEKNKKLRLKKKKFFQSKGYPPWIRNTLPLIQIFGRSTPMPWTSPRSYPSPEARFAKDEMITQWIWWYPPSRPY